MKQKFLFGVGLVIVLFGIWALVRSQRASVPAPIKVSNQDIAISTLATPALPALAVAVSPQLLPPTNAAPATIAAPVIQQPAPFVAFSDWAQRYLAGDPSANAAQGEALAWKRREAMLELIEADPAAAVQQVVPFRWRQVLPEKITRHFERWVDARGAFEVAMAQGVTHGKTTYRWAVIGDQRYDASVYGRRLVEPSHTNIPIHGVVLDQKMALYSEPIRILEPDEALARTQGKPSDVMCGVSAQSVDYPQAGLAGDIGGETIYFCSGDHVALVNQRWTLAESGGGSGAELVAGGGSTWTQGRKNVLYMRVNFPDDLTEPNSENAAYLTMRDVNAFYVAGSYDTTWLTTTVTPLLTLPQAKAWYSTAGPGALLNDARQAARKAGFDTVNYERDIVSHTAVPDFDWGGLGAVGGKGTWLQSYGAGVTSHELGHNYGLPHANFWDTLTNSSYSAIGWGTNVEYGNLFDTMGQASAGNNHFSAVFKNALGWLPNSAVHDITSSGLYRIYAFDTLQRVNGRLYAAKVRKDFDRDYWLEFRQLFTGNVSMQNGVLLNWSPWSQSNGGAQMIDTTFDTVDRSDSAVVVGRTFSDPQSAVHITTVGRGMNGTEPWLDVQVNLGPFPANGPPLLEVEVDPTNAAPGEVVHFHATASDANGDALAYSWNFDDNTFSTNNLPWTVKTWSQPGEHVVRCVVSDMKGGVASANIIVTVGQPSGYRVSGVIFDANDDPIEGVRVDTGLTNTNGYSSSITDSDGRFVLTGLTGDITLETMKLGYAFTNFGWQNPIQLSSNILRADFFALPLTNVSLAISTNVVTEGNATTSQLTLSRNNTNGDLSVILFVSGSASPTGDLSFNPPLATGTNFIVIPDGAARVTFNFAPVNNSMVENVETANITLFEDFAYQIAPAAEVRITVLDDDQPTPPEVSVAAGSGPVQESGADNGRFVFTRNGSTNSSLAVFYSVSGTATAGTDYPTLVGTVVIPAGSRSTAVEFRPQDDKDVESDETVIVLLTPNATYTIGTSSAMVQIVDDDLLVVTVAPTVAGLAEPAGSGRFTIKRDGDQSGNLVVYYDLSGTASNGVDYSSPSGAVTIPASQTSADVVINALNDALIEGDESVVLTVRTNLGYDIGTPGVATLFLRDDEKVTVSVSSTDPTCSEPGSDFGSFTISRGVTSGNLTVNFIVNGTAISGSDYVPLDNFVVIPDGASSVTLDVIPFDDLHTEPVEDIRITLIASTNYNLGTVQARVELEDDDSASVPAVGFTFSTSSALENLSPGVSLSLSATSAVPITVSYRLLGGTATSGTDFTLSQGLITFDPGERAKSIPLPIVDDSTIEPDETIRLTIFDPFNATLDGIKIHTYTIVDNDASSVSVAMTADASETGPASGNFRITRTGNTNASVQVNYQLTGTASAPSDFAPLGTSVIVPAGVAFVDLPVAPVNDGVVELDETVVMTLTSVPGGRIVAPNAATLTIVDDDPNSLPVVSVTSTNQPYAVEGGGNGAFVFTRTGPTNTALPLNISFSGTASGADYSLNAPLTIPIGQSSLTLGVLPVDDANVEGEETLTLSLTADGTYRVAYPMTATVTIQDNDQLVRLDASDFEASEPGTDDLGAFTFTRFGTTNFPVQIFYTISGTAGNGVDYTAIANSFVIPAGTLTATLPIVPLNDALVEGPEELTLTLQGNPSYTLSADTVGTVTILDDEPMVSIIAQVPQVIEGSKDPGVLRVLRGGDPSYEFTARLAIAGTAAYGVDYPPILTNILFSCGVMAVDLLIFPTNELVIENTETVNATLLPSPSYTIMAPSNAVVSIQDAGTNRAPLVTITSPTATPVFLLGTNVNLILESTLSDDGDTNTVITVAWTNVSGPGSLTFSNADQTNATVSFNESGVYVLRVTADDGALTNFAELTVVVDTLGLLASTLLHWPLDDGAGTNVTDISGGGHPGVVVGTPNWVTNGILGGALRFNGTNNLVREAAASALFNGRKQFTISLWVKAAGTNSTRGILTADESALSTLTLATRSFASCGSSTNVVEATVTTTRGDARHVSENNMKTNEWQHLAVTWSNGVAPLLYINGRQDQPLREMATMLGVLTNSSRLVLGKGPLDLPALWEGWIDDLRVFPRRMSPAELEGMVATNYGPIVQVPTNVTVQVVTPVNLWGTVTDDGRPNPPGVVSNTWVQVSGPVPVTLPAPHNLTNTVQFTQSGDYVFRLIAADGQVKVFDDLLVTVVEPTMVSVIATDSQAAELGPDTGEFMFTRFGDLSFDLSIQVILSGTASNGADFVTISLTNTVVLPTGVDTVMQTITPFLDHRTEGDETVIYTIVTNVAYSIGNAQATVTINDSPYGVWNIAHFTLEELTDPNLSGEGVDFDHDRYLNFVEYAVNRDPRTAETNAPVTTVVEFDPNDGRDHITFTYQRWLPPTDVAYEVRVSTNLRAWNTGTNFVQEVQVTPDANGLTETVKARVVAPWPSGTPQFIHLRVWLKATGP